MKLSLDELAEFFAIHSFRLKINGEKQIPTKLDLEMILSEAKRQLDEEEDFATLSVGHLRVEKAGEKRGVYVYFGDID